MGKEKEMSDLISRSRLKEELKSWAINIINPKCYLVEDADFVIDSQAAVDAVEVVMCKDCKHWHEETGWCAHHSHFIDSEGEACHLWESANWKMFDDNDYCSYGERKEQ